MTAVAFDCGVPSPSVNEPVDHNVFLRRRLAVGAGVATAVLLVIGLAVTIGGSQESADWIGTVDIASTTTASAATTTAAPTTTTTTVRATTAAPTTTTSTVPPTVPPTTILDNGVPVWPRYETLPPLDGIAALTGVAADESITNRPILAVKIDNVSRARPQWGLDGADAIIEENVEGVTRFVGLFHSNLPDRVGPVRSARTGDLDLFAGMNRPVVAWSGGNAGVTRWIRSAAFSQVLVDFSAQSNPCFQRNSSRPSPHNLLLDPECAVNTATEAGPARPLWPIDANWTPTPEMGATPDTTFDVEMDGVRVSWTWDADAGLYLRSQNGNPHVGVSGQRIAMNNVVELYTAHPPSPVDARSPNPVTVGGGRAVFHRDGVRIEGVWGRSTPYDSFGFADASGDQAVRLDEGRTFIELTRA
ncbi:MAG: hypothetical protein ACJAXA_000261 [Candidatus Aldehydirespiratoraceae bacterium]